MDEQTKECTLCGETKTFSQFNKHPRARFGLTPRCKTCLNPQSRAYYKAHPEKWKEKEAELRAKDPEALKKKNRDAATRWRSDPANTLKKRMDYIEGRYGITFQQFEDMEKIQGGLCKICGQPPSGVKGRLHIDHDHATGKVRALLCFGCNSGIGSLKDSPALLRAAADYIESFRGVETIQQRLAHLTPDPVPPLPDVELTADFFLGLSEAADD